MKQNQETLIAKGRACLTKMIRMENKIQMKMKITIPMLQPLPEVPLLSPYACQGYVKGCNVEIETIIIETMRHHKQIIIKR